MAKNWDWDDAFNDAEKMIGVAQELAAAVLEEKEQAAEKANDEHDAAARVEMFTTDEMAFYLDTLQELYDDDDVEGAMKLMERIKYATKLVAKGKVPSDYE